MAFGHSNFVNECMLPRVMRFPVLVLESYLVHLGLLAWLLTSREPRKRDLKFPRLRLPHHFQALTGAYPAAALSITETQRCASVDCKNSRCAKLRPRGPISAVAARASA